MHHINILKLEDKNPFKIKLTSKRSADILSVIISGKREIHMYYILNKEIQEFLVKIKMLFLRCLEIFISSRKINLCRLDTLPTMVANRPVMFNRVPAFGRVKHSISVCSSCLCSVEY